MKLPKIAINNAQFIFILAAVITVFCTKSFFEMPRAEDPLIELPFYNIIAVYPGTNTKDMENLIVDPIEEVLNEIDDIKEVRSNIQTGVAKISISASFDVDGDRKYDEIVRELNNLRNTLPKGIVYFNISQYKATERNSIYQYAMVSESVPYVHLLEYSEKLEEELQLLDEIKAIDIEAYPEKEVRISLDFQRMASKQITLQQVIRLLTTNNQIVPGGALKAGDKNFSITTTGAYTTLDDIRNTIITNFDGSLIYLKDIADVHMDYEDIRWIGRFNQKKAIWISIKIKKDANLLNVAEKIKAVEASFRKQLPSSIALETAFEQAPAVKKRLDDFFTNLLQGILLVGLVIFLFLGWRPSIIIMTIFPICILISLAILHWCGFALQQISIASVVIALGLLVDNGIVVVENINRYLKDGLSLKDAAAKGTEEVGYAVISSTVTTVLSFIPLLYLAGGPGEFLKSHPTTVVLTLIVSLVLSLTLTPILASKLMKRKKSDRKDVANKFMEYITTRIYRPILNFSLRFGWVLLALAMGLLVFSVGLFPKIGTSFFPTADKALLLIDVEAPEGTNIDGTDKAIRYIESILDTMDYVENYCANVGHGNPQVYYNRFPVNYNTNKGQVMVNFKSWEPQTFYNTLVRLRTLFQDYPNASITFRELKNGASREAPIEFHVYGENYDTLKNISAQLEQIFRATPGVINIKNPLRIDKTELNIELNKEKAAMVNLSYLGFDQIVRSSIAGLKIDQVSLDDGKDYPMVVRMPFEKQPSIFDFNKVYFSSPTTPPVPLRQLADVNFKSSRAEIAHTDMRRHSRLLAGVVNPDKAIAITQSIIDKLPELTLPDGYTIEVKGEFEGQKETFGDLGTILIFAQIAIFAVLVLQFRSIMQPLAVFSAIPFAVSGSFIALYLTGWPFSFLAFVGFISLIGIVVNNSIIMVDHINQLRKNGLARIEAIKMGSERRLTPVVLTTITTILGILPLTVSQSNLWSPLGWTIIGGMISSTLMTLMIVPVLYKWFTRG